MIDARTAEVVEMCLLNDESSSDEELHYYFVKEFGMKAAEARFYVAQRDRALRERLAHFELKPYSATEQLVRQLALCTKDGECTECGQDGEEDNPDCEDHDAWVMENDDAVDTLESFISMAREIVDELEGVVKEVK